MFCGNCGRAVNAAPIPATRVADPRPSDTTVLRPGSHWTRARDAASLVVGLAAPESAETGHAGSADGGPADAGPGGREPADTEAADARAANAGSANAATDPSGVEVRITGVPVSETPVTDVPATEVPLTEVPLTGLPSVGVPSPDHPLQGGSPRSVSAASARAEARTGATEERFPTMPRPIIPPVPYVLSFSTGERVVVVGTGLLGRRPFTQPGERFDQLVSIADYERSVSKTHLEFGLEDDQLWICDRYSANGTVIIPRAGGPHRCEPGRRYRVPRGGRVEIGDHWFDVR